MSIIDKKGVSERVADYIKEQIIDGKYPTGDRIPGEREMATKLEISRNTVREAYKILEAYGYLRSEHGRGVFITTEAEQIRKMTESFFVSSSQIVDLFAVRKVLEEAVVKWAIEKGTKENIEELELIVGNAEKIISQGESPINLAEYDLQFHLYIAQMSNNEVALRIMHHLIDLLAQSRAQSIQIPDRGKKSVAEHKEITRAIKDKNVKRATKLIRHHLETVEKAIVDYLS